MHIALVTPEFMTEGVKGGGLASYINNIAHIFVAHGDTVTIITLSDKNDNELRFEQGIVIERVKKAGVPSGKCRQNITYIIDSVRVNARVQSVHKKRPIDIVQYANFGSLALCNMRNIPSVVRLSSDSILWREAERANFSFRDSINNMKMADFLEYVSVKNADVVFGPSNYIAGIVGARIHKKIQVIESPFYLTQGDFDESIYLRALKGKKYVLTHSALTRLKGIHTIGASLYHVLEQHSDLFWVFAGNDRGIPLNNGQCMSAVNYLKKCAGKYVNRLIFLGALDRKRLYPVISHSLFCVLPSIADNLPNACIEAMALRRVVIGTHGSSIEQLITHRNNGILIHKNAPFELEDAVAHCYCMTAAQREKLGEMAYQRMLELEPEKVYHRLMELYHPLIMKSKSKRYMINQMV